MVNRTSDNMISRRDFLARVTAMGGAAVLAAALQACTPQLTSQPTLPTPTRHSEQITPSPSPTSTSTARPSESGTPTAAGATSTPTTALNDGNAKIAFVKTSNRAEGVRQALDLLGINPVSGKRVFLKPNFNSDDPTPGSTHPEVLAALVTALKGMGAVNVTVGDRSGMGDTRRVMERLGIFRLADELGFDTLVFDELPDDQWVMIQPEDGHWEQGFPFARPCLEADALVQTCCLKTHRYGGHFTLSLKNSVGLAAKRLQGNNHNFMQELHGSAHQRRMIAEINAAYVPSLILLDGVEAFISGGPDKGEEVAPEVILAGTDRIAIDAVGVALLRYYGCQTEVAQGKIFEQEQIARAVELKLGVDRPEKIEFLTADTATADFANAIQKVLLAD